MSENLDPSASIRPLRPSRKCRNFSVEPLTAEGAEILANNRRKQRPNYKAIQAKRCDPKFPDTLNFFRSFFGFAPPYKILMDRSFILSVLMNDFNIPEIQTYLSECFGGKCQLMMTKCVLNKLYSTYTDETVLAAVNKHILVLDCLCSFETERVPNLSGEGHPKRKIFDCMMRLVRNTNQFSGLAHGPRRKKFVRQNYPYILGTQKANHFLEAREMIGVPVIYFDMRILHMDNISKPNRSWLNIQAIKKRKSLKEEKSRLNIHAFDSDDLQREGKTPTRNRKAATGGYRGGQLSPDINDVVNFPMGRTSEYVVVPKKKIRKANLPMFDKYKTVVNRHLLFPRYPKYKDDVEVRKYIYSSSSYITDSP